MMTADSKTPRPAEPNEAKIEHREDTSPKYQRKQIPTKGFSDQLPQKEPRAGTQIATVLDLLRSRPDGWVGVNEIMREGRCAAAHSTISTLRQKYGFRIENRMSRAKGGIVLSEYQLLEGRSE